MAKAMGVKDNILLQANARIFGEFHHLLKEEIQF